MHWAFSAHAWQRPTFPGARAPSIIGAGGLHGRVRDGNACFPSAIVTRLDKGYCTPLLRLHEPFRATPFILGYLTCNSGVYLTHKVDTLETECECHLSCQPGYALVKPSTDSYPSAPHIAVLPHRTDLPRLLQGVLLHCWMGYVILRGASRLDAFSAYPFPT